MSLYLCAHAILERCEVEVATAYPDLSPGALYSVRWLALQGLMSPERSISMSEPSQPNTLTRG